MRRTEGGRDEKGETERVLRGEVDILGDLAQVKHAHHSDLNVMR